MRVRVSYVVDVDDDSREAITRYHCSTSIMKATRDEVHTFYRQQGEENGNAILADVMFAMERES